MMRRLPALLVLALAAIAVLFVAGLMMRPALVLGTVARALGAVRHDGADAIVSALAAPASAQQVLEFKPVPAESAAKLDARRATRRSTATLPSPPSPPSAPVPPSPPGAPRTEFTIGKSGNIMRVGSDIQIERDQVVVGDVMAVGGDVTVDGHVEGDVVSMGGDVYLNATARVDGDVVCMGGELHEEEGSSIGGQRVTAIGKGGRRHPRHLDLDVTPHWNIGPPLVWLLIQLLIAWVFAGLAPGRTTTALASLKREPGSAALTGFLAAILVVPSIVAISIVAALLCITIIGIPVAVAALLGYFGFLGVLWLWGFVVGAAALGERIAARRSAQSISLTRAALYGVLAIGGAGVVGAILHLPGIGAIGGLIRVLSWLAFSVVTLMGSGAWLRVEFDSGMLSRIWGRGRRAAAEGTIPPAPVAGGTAPPPEATPPVGA